MEDFNVDDLGSEKRFRSAASKHLMAAPKVKAPKEPKQPVTIIQGYTPDIQTPFQPNASGVEDKRRYLGRTHDFFLMKYIILTLIIKLGTLLAALWLAMMMLQRMLKWSSATKVPTRTLA